MKKTVILFSAILLANLLMAQSQPICDPFPKTISVTGSAVMEVIPDEIYVQVDLREYKKREKKKLTLIKLKLIF